MRVPKILWSEDWDDFNEDGSEAVGVEEAEEQSTIVVNETIRKLLRRKNCRVQAHLYIVIAILPLKRINLGAKQRQRILCEQCFALSAFDVSDFR